MANREYEDTFARYRLHAQQSEACLRARITALERQVSSLREALTKFGGHSYACLMAGKLCVCGWDDARCAALSSKPEAAERERDDLVAGHGNCNRHDVYALVKTAYEHWYNIGWPEDKKPVAMLMRALKLLGPEPEAKE
jgi:hypothetical protein